MASRIAIDRLQSAQRRREAYVGPWLPEPIPADPLLGLVADPADQVVLAESISIGLLSILECLGPRERAVFLLREVFGMAFAEIAGIVGRSEPATRQIAKRARDRVRSQRPRFHPTPAQASQLAEGFLEALMSGDIERFACLLDHDVVAVSDGGAKTRAARVPVVGRHRVSRFMVNLAKRTPDGAELHALEFNGQPCFYLTLTNDDGAQPFLLVTINWLEGQVQSLVILRNTDKLAGVHLHWLAQQG